MSCQLQISVTTPPARSRRYTRAIAAAIFLHHFGITSRLQGKGYGSLLADASLKFVKEKGYQVKLEVHKENRAAKALYEKFGFFPFRNYDIYMIRRINEIGWGTE